ncbi:MAG: hypothetical protein EON87_03640 [Brevundimonas sp.]|nr:MAG: hypothetical protein EON87_03640 [Brevundimonas sp.]
MAISVAQDLTETFVTPSAELIRRRDGGPVRLRRNGNRKTAMGILFSAKNGCHLPWDAKTELKVCQWAEVSTDVVSYMTQPHTLRMVADGRQVTYTPDVRFDLAGGGVQVVEVKNRFDVRKDPAYSRKLKQAAQVYAALGYTFTLVESADYEREPVFSAITTLNRFKSTLVDQPASDTVIDVLANGPAPLARVLEVAPEGPRGIASLASMMVRRVISIEIEHGLVADAPVTLVRPNMVGTPLFVGRG